MQRKEFLASLTTAGVGSQLGATAHVTNARPSRRGPTMEYLGAAGWIVRSDTATILIDPYVSRINGPPPPGVARYSALGDSRTIYSWDDAATADAHAIAKYIPTAELILVTHTHYDHVLDAPHIALRTGARVLGTESTQNVMRAYGVRVIVPAYFERITLS